MSRIYLSLLLMASVLVLLAGIPGCGEGDSDDEQINQVRKELAGLRLAEAKYYKRHGRYTDSLADLQLLGIVDATPANQPGDQLATPGQQREIHVSSNGQLVSISVTNANGENDAGASVSLYRGAPYGEGCVSVSGGC